MKRDLADDGWIQMIKGNPFYLFDPHDRGDRK